MNAVEDAQVNVKKIRLSHTWWLVLYPNRHLQVEEVGGSNGRYLPPEVMARACFYAPYTGGRLGPVLALDEMFLLDAHRAARKRKVK